MRKPEIWKSGSFLFKNCANSFQSKSSKLQKQRQRGLLGLKATKNRAAFPSSITREFHHIHKNILRPCRRFSFTKQTNFRLLRFRETSKNHSSKKNHKKNEFMPIKMQFCAWNEWMHSYAVNEMQMVIVGVRDWEFVGKKKFPWTLGSPRGYTTVFFSKNILRLGSFAKTQPLERG